MHEEIKKKWKQSVQKLWKWSFDYYLIQPPAVTRAFSSDTGFERTRPTSCERAATGCRRDLCSQTKPIALILLGLLPAQGCNSQCCAWPRHLWISLFWHWCSWSYIHDHELLCRTGKRVEHGYLSCNTWIFAPHNSPEETESQGSAQQAGRSWDGGICSPHNQERRNPQ